MPSCPPAHAKLIAWASTGEALARRPVALGAVPGGGAGVVAQAVNGLQYEAGGGVIELPAPDQVCMHTDSPGDLLAGTRGVTSATATGGSSIRRHCTK
jgi:hypothetical protein